jgi:hypothetical protein
VACVVAHTAIGAPALAAPQLSGLPGGGKVAAAANATAGLDALILNASQVGRGYSRHPIDAGNRVVAR